MPGLRENREQTLHWRRPGLSFEFDWPAGPAGDAGAHRFACTVNLDPVTGLVMELFIKGAREESALGAYAFDVGVLISDALQGSLDPDGAADTCLRTLAAKLQGDVPDPTLGGTVCRLAAEHVEAELGAGVGPGLPAAVGARGDW